MAATLVALSGIAARAQTDAEVSALIAEALLLPDWFNVFTVTTGAGYKDNIFLAHDDPQARPFVSFVGEFLSFRPAPVGPRMSFFSHAEAHHFFGGGLSHQEYTAFSQGQVEHAFTDTLTVSVLGQYYYQDQVLDVSVSETNRVPSPVRGHTLGLRPAARLDLPRRLWLELEAPLARQFFEEPLDDYYEAGFKLTLGWKYYHDSQLSLACEPLWRPYDTDPARTATGAAITNSHRFSFQQNARLKWAHNWDEEKHWRTVAILGGRMNNENGEGFSDYTRWLVSGRLEYRAHGWDIFAEGRFSSYHYQVQSVSPTNPAHRERSEWAATLQIERQLSDKIALVGTFDHETTDSNDPLETYSVNTVSLALRWEF
jgi:hypothetical protein